MFESLEGRVSGQKESEPRATGLFEDILVARRSAEWTDIYLTAWKTMDNNIVSSCQSPG